MPDVMPPLISITHLAMVASLVILNAGLSIFLQLGLTRSLLIAALRMVIQLSLVGLVLKAVFSISSPWLTMGIAILMALFAGREIMARQTRRFKGVLGYGLGTSVMFISSLLVTWMALGPLLQTGGLSNPQMFIPLLGMILGNTMTGVSLALDSYCTQAYQDRGSIEARLSLGQTRWQANNHITRRALRAGFMPIINSMSATGLVALPGMMTGQILAGVDPSLAVRYQILIMFLIAGSAGLGTIMAVFSGVFLLTDKRHRLRLDRLK